jgi:hypothetical protein
LELAKKRRGLERAFRRPLGDGALDRLMTLDRQTTLDRQMSGVRTRMSEGVGAADERR